MTDINIEELKIKVDKQFEAMRSSWTNTQDALTVKERWKTSLFYNWIREELDRLNEEVRK